MTIGPFNSASAKAFDVSSRELLREMKERNGKDKVEAHILWACLQIMSGEPLDTQDAIIMVSLAKLGYLHFCESQTEEVDP